jgi:hypothetical protein
MEHQCRPPSLNLISSSSPARPVSTSPSPLHRQSQSPFRYVQFHQDPTDMNEKVDQTPLSDFNPDKQRQLLLVGHSAHEQTSQSHPIVNHPLSSPFQPRITRPHHPLAPSPLSQTPSPFVRQPPLLLPNRNRRPSHSQPYTRPRGLRIANLLKPWLPLIMYGLTSLAFLVAIGLYRTEVFAREFQMIFEYFLAYI